MSTYELTLAVAVIVMVSGAVGTALCTDVLRLVISLATFLLGVALAFLTLGSALLAVAEVFAYVGGVLVLVLFALMLTGRSADERPRLMSRRDLGAGITALLVFGLLSWALSPVSATVPAEQADAAAIADYLLGSGFVVFELVGLVLLLALLAVLAVVKGGDER